MIGEIHLNDCIARPADCRASQQCAVHRVWQDAREQLRTTLRQVSFAQLIADTSCLSSSLKGLLDSKGLEVTGSIRGELQ
jgi:DNA-binding IscR family transcriptional regulator